MAHDDAFPPLTPTELTVVESFGVRSRVEVGDVLFHSGDPSYDFFASISASVQIINGTDGTDGTDDIVTEHGP